MNDEHDIDLIGLAEARWLRLVHALLKFDEQESNRDQRARLALQIELELGLSSIMDLPDRTEEPTHIQELIRTLELFVESNPGFLAALVMRLERAFAAFPHAWLDYVKENGRACFDPAELAACAATAKNHTAPGAADHKRVLALIHWSWDALLGQRPVPFVQVAVRHGHPTVILDVIKAIEDIEVNWASLGLRPIINRDLALRWDQFERWTAFVKLIQTDTGKISSHTSLRLRSDGIWRIVRSRT